MSSDNEIDTGPDAEDMFSALVGDDIEPLGNKGASYLAKPVSVTPGVLQRRKAAQQEKSREGNFLDPVTVIAQVDPYEYCLLYTSPSPRDRG